jgi:hypothetical protein
VSSTHGVGRARKHSVTTFAVTGMLAAVTMLIAASMAMGTADVLKGGTTTLSFSKLKVSKASGGAVKTGKKSASLSISGGKLDPTNGTGAVTNGGSLKVKKGSKKAILSEITTTFGTSISAKLKGKTVTLATLAGGTVGRAGFGGTVTNATEKLTKKGAKALNKALKTSSFKKGKPFGKASTSTIPKTVTVLGGTTVTAGAADPVTPPGGGFGKLVILGGDNAHYGHGVGSTDAPFPQGITVSGGASYPGATGGPITTPVTGGAIAPDASTGVVHTGGTVKITKTVASNTAPFTFPGVCETLVTPMSGGSSVGNFLQLANSSNDIDQKALLSDITVNSAQAGFPSATLVGTQAGASALDFSGATTVANAAAKTIKVSGIKATTTTTGVSLLKGIYGVEAAGCGPVGSDPVAGDLFATITMNLTTQ